MAENPIHGMTVDEATALHAERYERITSLFARRQLRIACGYEPVPRRYWPDQQGGAILIELDYSPHHQDGKSEPQTRIGHICYTKPKP